MTDADAQADQVHAEVKDSVLTLVMHQAGIVYAHSTALSVQTSGNLAHWICDQEWCPHALGAMLAVAVDLIARQEVVITTKED
jgi:hypothetical protein